MVGASPPPQMFETTAFHRLIRATGVRRAREPAILFHRRD